MGLFDELLLKKPGDPTSIAKTVLNTYKRFYSNNPSATKEEALRFAIESRYEIFPIMKKDEIENILDISKSLGELVLYIIEKEYSDNFSDSFEDLIISELYEFFRENAPNEMGGIKDLYDEVILNKILKNNNIRHFYQLDENNSLIVYCPNCNKKNKITFPPKYGKYNCGSCKSFIFHFIM
jgi:hypothetical protein